MSDSKVFAAPAPRCGGSSRARKPWHAPKLTVAPVADITANNNTPQDDTGNGFGSGNDLPS